MASDRQGQAKTTDQRAARFAGHEIYRGILPSNHLRHQLQRLIRGKNAGLATASTGAARFLVVRVWRSGLVLVHPSVFVV